MEKIPSSKVIDAVIVESSKSSSSSLTGNNSNNNNNNKKVIASDIATRAGTSITDARKELTTLASISKGDISVSSDGELLYEFPTNLKDVLSSNSAKYKALQRWEKAWPNIFWVTRISFGVALLVSVALIFSTIFVLQTSAGGGSSNDNDDRRDNRRSGGGMMPFGGPSYFWGPSPFDFFYYRPYGGYGYYGQPVTERPRDPEEMGFLESIFSFVFGDGNPNQGLEEQRLTFVAQMIRDNKGAVTAEQLAPYCDAPDPDSSSTTSSDNKYIDESFVLPIVSQLDGQPRVTEEGDIIYVFPELQVSATESRVVPQASEQNMILKRAGLPPNVTPKEIQNLLMMNGISTRSARDKQDLIDLLEKALPPMTPEEEDELLQSDPTMLMEREYKFSVASGLNKFFAGALGVVNLGGALYLGNLFNQYALYNVRLPSFLGVAQTFYPLLVGYAILFNAIPFVRNLWISSENDKIQKRNDARKKWRERALQPSQTIIRKLKAARKFATNRKLLTEQDIVYDTKQTAADLQRDRNKNDLDEFDKLLNEQKPFQ
eukprot:CAMPEP_0113500240 /NCGR_PEP_ID=MMETSP0014_2-20120614/32202_1 /TAXON_ID=2857 /ORGANISM="Nitzschia sp." /LENGTH=544 /DNA_ID=CAMNT_0000394521 /DNA_START=713 /DNA_END=2347 /DNA_ORIENTATION=+ /assembly_acc=CAM_ASM_000159